jgi:hypothetical protein
MRRGGGWGTQQPIEINNAGSAEAPQVAMDSNGNAVAVWQHSDGTRFKIWSNRYTPSGDWGLAEAIENNAGNATEPQVAMGPNGDAVAVWQQSDGTRFNIWSNRYTPSERWETPQRIGDQGSARNPQVDVDAQGDAVAVWTQLDGSRDSIWSNRNMGGGEWGTAQRIVVDDAGRARQPQVAVDPQGNAVTVWLQSEGPTDRIWSNRLE